MNITLGHEVTIHLDLVRIEDNEVIFKERLDKLEAPGVYGEIRVSKALLGCIDFKEDDELAVDFRKYRPGVFVFPNNDDDDIPF